MSETEWKPIETAPKDGTSILGFEPAGDAPYGEDTMATMMWHRSDFAADCWADPLTLHCVFDAPTHWMPLPQPPESN